MKAKFFIFGCLCTILCLSGCDDKEISVSSINISPATISPMEVGDEVELTATVSPADATEEIIWVSWDEDIATVTGHGDKAMLKAISPGKTRIYATNKSKIVVSPDLAVTVNSDDFASLMAGDYIGNGSVSGMMNDNISDMGITIQRLEAAVVKMTVLANMPGFGEQTITANNLNVLAGSTPGTYTLSGTAGLSIMGMNLSFNVTGTFKSSDNSLTMQLLGTDPSIPLTINFTAVPGVSTDYAASVIGNYIGAGNVSGMASGNISDAVLTMERVGTEKAAVKMTLIASIASFGEQTIIANSLNLSAGSETGTYALSGNAGLSIMGMDIGFNVTGTFKVSDKTFSVQLLGTDPNIPLTITINAVPGTLVIPTDYAVSIVGNYIGSGNVSGAANDNISDAEIILERIGTELDAVKMTLIASIGAFGEQTIIANSVKLSDGSEAGTYALNGSAGLSIMGMDIGFSVTGTYKISDKTMTLQLVSTTAAIPLTINLNAVPPTPQTDYAAMVAGNYTGSGSVSGMANDNISGATITMEHIESEKAAVKMTIIATIAAFGEQTIIANSVNISDGSETGTFALSGNAGLSIMGMDLGFSVTGTFKVSDETFTIQLVSTTAGFNLTINLSAVPAS